MNIRDETKEGIDNPPPSVEYTTEERMLNNLRSIDGNVRQIRFWVSFWGWLGIIGALAWLVVLLAACSDPWSPPDHWVHYEPLPTYAQWWVEVETCSGLEGNMATVAWYTTTETRFLDNHSTYGLWWPPHNIAIVERHRDFQPVVQHEMLHDLIGHSDPYHARPEWAGCGV